MMKSLLWLNKVGCFLQSPLLLLIRLYWGYQFTSAGYKKFLDLDKTTAFFDSLEIPFPAINAVGVATVELVCGLLLTIGLLSRLASIPLMFVMCGAYLTAKQETLISLLSFDPNSFFQASPFLFLYASLLVFCFGPGKISCDYFILEDTQR